MLRRVALLVLSWLNFIELFGVVQTFMKEGGSYVSSLQKLFIASALSVSGYIPVQATDIPEIKGVYNQGASDTVIAEANDPHTWYLMEVCAPKGGANSNTPADITVVVDYKDRLIRKSGCAVFVAHYVRTKGWGTNHDGRNWIGSYRILKVLNSAAQHTDP